MNDRVGQAQQLGKRLVAGWRPEDVEAQLASLHARKRRTRARQRVLVPIVGAAFATAISLVVWNFRGGETEVRSEIAVAPVPKTPPAPVAPVEVPHEPAAASGALLLGDGSVVMPLGKDSRLTARKV
ncbi:MAG TPA: hypothetical protein VGO00_18485, partial [Kofleriaceae bacterium]|nr:hypothetical protein [Kofleriaceae bacterium]